MWFKRITVSFGLICATVTMVIGVGKVYQPGELMSGFVMLAVGLVTFVMLIADFFINRPQIVVKTKKEKK